MHRESRGMIGRETCLGYLASNLHLHVQKCVQASGRSYPVPLLVIGESSGGAAVLQGDPSLEKARDAGTARYPRARSMPDDMVIDSGDQIHGLRV